MQRSEDAEKIWRQTRRVQIWQGADLQSTHDEERVGCITRLVQRRKGAEQVYGIAGRRNTVGVFAESRVTGIGRTFQRRALTLTLTGL
jgi:hypothetical protein